MLPFLFPLHTDSLCTRYTTSHRIFLQQRDSNLSREVTLHSSLFLFHSIPLHNLQLHSHPHPNPLQSPLSLHVSLDEKFRSPNSWNTFETATFQLSTRFDYPVAYRRTVYRSISPRYFSGFSGRILVSIPQHRTGRCGIRQVAIFGSAASECLVLDE